MKKSLQPLVDESRNIHDLDQLIQVQTGISFILVDVFINLIVPKA